MCCRGKTVCFAYARLTLCDFCRLSAVETTKDVKSCSERAADNRLSLTRQRDSCWTDSKIESVQQLLNESERSFDQRRIV